VSEQPRRIVRTTPRFFADLDRQLPAERGEDGTPSRGDFQAYELLRIVDAFATEFDGMLQPIPGRPDYRVLILAGLIVPRVSVTGQLRVDGSVELLELLLDWDWGWDADDEPDD
jgi:hypothetical protein